MLNDRDRHLLNDLERQLQQEDPAWVRQFKDPKPPHRTRRDLRLGTAMGLLVLLTALCLLLDIPVGAVIFGSAAIVLAYIRYHR
jgi:4-hydroxybenzoate polyprenyltransferase